MTHCRHLPFCLRNMHATLQVEVCQLLQMLQL